MINFHNFVSLIMCTCTLYILLVAAVFSSLYYAYYSGTSIMSLRIKDTSILRTAIDGPKCSAIETCTYLTSELKIPLYFILRALTLHR